jgi:DNA-binding NarL/FixJ family response regulator
MGRADLLIVEDHPLFRAGLAHVAAQARPNWTLHFADTAGDARAVLSQLRASAVLIDIGLPDESGLSLAQSLVRDDPALSVLIISAREDPAATTLARRCGAKGFIGKDARPDDLIAAIEAVMNGEEAFDAGKSEDVIPALTTRQEEVLALLQEGCSNKEMRYRLGIAERTVRAHLTELFVLLGVHSRTQAIIRARELGLAA